MGIMGEGFFRIRAYREAGRVIMEETEKITEKTTKNDLLLIPRIGQALADKILELIKNGHIKFLDKLRLEIPKSVRDLLKIPGLGPGRIGKLFFLAGIQSKKELIKAAKNDQLISLPGFGKKTIDNIMNAISSSQQKKKRHKRSEVEPVAKKIISILKKIKGVEKVEIAGSFRRQNPTVGDLDILVSGNPNLKQAEKAILKKYSDHTLLGSGSTKISFVIFPANLQIDIRFVPEESWGAALLYFTGSKDYNVMMRKVAIEKELLLNEYGLFRDGEYIAGKTEKEVCKKLGLPYLEPKSRK
ncbi:hypothetical protein KKA95_00400 [Patescibacteria group bacterium]|nr:hypothetical protein [Patescibacteria group bacterium]